MVRFSLPESYPLAPPRAAFETKIFHPNVHWKTGEICLDILKDAWSPAWTLHSVCRAVLALLCNPEPDSPLNCDAGNMLRARDDIAYWSTARMYTRREAGGSAMAKTAWPPIRADREMADDERGETFTSAGRRRALPSGTSKESLDPERARGGEEDGDAQNQNADGASGSEEDARTVTPKTKTPRMSRAGAASAPGPASSTKETFPSPRQEKQKQTRLPTPPRVIRAPPPPRPPRLGSRRRGSRGTRRARDERSRTEAARALDVVSR